MTRETPLLGAGDLLCNRFLLDRQVGSAGTIGWVFRAIDQLTQMQLVVKITHADMRDELIEQYRKLLVLHSSDFPRTLGYFEHDSESGLYPVLALEEIKGEVLSIWHRNKSIRERVTALARITSALIALHETGSHHGDLHGENIIVAGDRFVLIDPETDIWSSGRTRRLATENSLRRDMISLAEISRDLFPEKQNTGISPVLCQIESERPQSLRGVVIALNAALTDQVFPDELSGELRHFAAASKRSRDERFRLYAHLRLVRQMAIDQFFAAIKDQSMGLDVKTEESTKDTTDEAYDSASLGSFRRRELRCVTAENDQWWIEFSEASNFRKPWPEYEHGVIAKGASEVFHHPYRSAEQVVLRLVGEQASFLIRQGNYTYPADSQWMRRCLEKLEGFRVSALAEPYQIEGHKVPVDEWPREPKLIDGDLSPLLEDATGLDWLKQSIHSFLKWSQDSQTTLSMSHPKIFCLFKTPRSDRQKFIADFSLDGLVKWFGRYIDLVIRFDVVFLGRSEKALKVELEIAPHGGSRVNWEYVLSLGGESSSVGDDLDTDEPP